MTSVVATQFVPLVATAAATRDFMVVSLHDVAPSNWDLACKIISELSCHARCRIGIHDAIAHSARSPFRRRVLHKIDGVQRSQRLAARRQPRLEWRTASLFEE